MSLERCSAADADVYGYMYILHAIYRLAEYMHVTITMYVCGFIFVIGLIRCVCLIALSQRNWDQIVSTFKVVCCKWITIHALRFMVFSVIFLSIRMMYIMPMFTRMSAVDRCERFVSFENRVESVRSNNTEIIAECVNLYFTISMVVTIIKTNLTRKQT